MKISFNPINIINYNHYRKNIKKYSNIAPLSFDTVSFGSMKKEEFVGVDYAAIRKFRAHIEKFNSYDDFLAWEQEKIDEITKKSYPARRIQADSERKAMLNEWFNYVTKENATYNKSHQLIILSAIIKDLNPNNDKLPPVLNRGALAECIDELDAKLKENPKYCFDFNKMYSNKLQEFYLDDNINTGETATKWVVIPSKAHDSDNFEKNIDKLKTLSHRSWCTKSRGAKTYLEQGDFHIYLENGKPKLGLAFNNQGMLYEIEGEKNNRKIPVKYLEILENYIKENNITTTKFAESCLITSRKVEQKTAEIKDKLKQVLDSNDSKAIFNMFGITVKEDENGNLIISHYCQPSFDYSFDDLGIDENELLKKVIRIEGNANFDYSSVKKLENLQSIGKDASFRRSDLESLGSLQYIGGSAKFEVSNLKSLGMLQTIAKDADFGYSKLEDLGMLQSIGGSANFEKSVIKSLGMLETIGKDADFRYSKLEDLGILQSIGGSANFKNSIIQSLGILQTIGKDADFGYSKLEDLGMLQSIGGSANFEKSTLEDLGMLENIGGNAYFKNSKLKTLENVSIIGADADFSNSQITNLGSLRIVKGNAKFSNSPLTNLGNLEFIGDAALFINSQVRNLGKLRQIEGDLHIDKNSQIDFQNVAIKGDIIKH